VSRLMFYTPLRRAHVIAPFGPGALLLTSNRVSAIVCGPGRPAASVRSPSSTS